MKLALRLLATLALLGGFDTLYYHEWRARLPALGRLARSELRLHAFRDFVYALLFAGLPWLAFQGWYVVILVALFLIEIILTLWDFVVEDWVRKPLGGVYPGERAMHGIMGIVYGGMLAYLVPTLQTWWNAPSELAASQPAAGEVLRWLMAAMALGVFLSGIRDMCAAAGLRGTAWPWGRH
jgi:hypothetical protein